MEKRSKIPSLTIPVQSCRHWCYLGAALVPASASCNQFFNELEDVPVVIWLGYEVLEAYAARCGQHLSLILSAIVISKVKMQQ